MNEIPFVKYTANGNNFVIVDEIGGRELIGEARLACVERFARLPEPRLALQDVASHLLADLLLPQLAARIRVLRARR